MQHNLSQEVAKCSKKSISIVLLDYLGIREIGDYQQRELASLNQRINQTEETLRTIKKLETLDETNENLKQNTLKFSPNGKKYAYFQHKLTANIEEIGDEDYTSLIVYYKGKEETIFQGNFRLSNFAWLNDEDIVIYRSCGTECMIAYIVNLNSKTQSELALGVGYTWSPNKKYVLAYHYSYKYGISVADKGGLYRQNIFQLRRIHPSGGSGLVNKTKAAWSPDSSKLGLIIKKEDQEKLELLVFNVENDIKAILQKDLNRLEITDFGWKDEKTVYYITDEKANEIKL